jgi:hypothetical protein
VTSGSASPGASSSSRGKDGQLHPVPPALLGGVHGLVGAPLKRRGGLSPVPGRDADGHRLHDARVAATPYAIGAAAAGHPDRLARRATSDALGDDPGLRGRGARHEQHELLAPVARQHVHPARGRAHALGEPTQHLIADRVPVLVVDPLEVIEVQEEHAERLAPPSTGW